MLCEMTRSFTQVSVMISTAALCMVIYLMCFALGIKNIYSILYKQSYYKSVFLVLQYTFGQIICLLKATSLIFIIYIIANIENKGYCKMGDITLLRHIAEFDGDMWYAKTAAYFVVWTMTMKVCMGMVTVMMVLALYIKVDIIYNQFGTDKWEKFYKYIVYTSLALVFLINVAYGTQLIIKSNHDYNNYFVGLKVVTNADKYGDWWGSILTFLGTFTGI